MVAVIDGNPLASTSWGGATELGLALLISGAAVGQVWQFSNYSCSFAVKLRKAELALDFSGLGAARVCSKLYTFQKPLALSSA